MSLELKKIMEECEEIYKEKQLKENIEKLIKKNQYILSDSILRDKKLKIVKENIKYYIDYKKKNIDISSEFGYKSILINVKDGLTKDVVINILTNICLNISNVYIIINCNKIITKKNVELIDNDNILKSNLIVDYDSNKKLQIKKKINEENDYEDFEEDENEYDNNNEDKEEDFLKKVKNKIKIYREKSKKYSLIRKNIPKYLSELSKKNAKILILSLSSKDKIKRIFNYYDIDKYVTEYFTQDMCIVKSDNKVEKIRELLDKINSYVNNNKVINNCNKLDNENNI